MNKILFVFICLSCNCIGQKLTVINQNGEIIKCPLEIELTTPTKYSMTIFDTSSYIVKSSTHEKQIIQIHVNSCKCIKEYYNEFTLAQITQLDTLMLYEDCIMKDYYPRILFGDFDAWVADSVDYNWFGSYLQEINFIDSDKFVEIRIQSSGKLSRCQRSKILKHSDKIKAIFDVPEDRIQFIFTDEHYTIRDTDKFIPGQIVDKHFIRNQNTEFMRNRASSFRVVGVVNIGDSIGN